MAKRKPRAKNVYFTPEPDWKALREETDNEKREKIFQDCQYFGRTEISDKPKIALTRKWIKDKSGWDKNKIKIILKNPDWVFSSSATVFFMEDKLGWMPENTRSHIDNRSEEWLKRGHTVVEEAEAKAEEKASKPKISIQQRMHEQIDPLLGEWEGYIDDYLDGKMSLKDFDPYNDMRAFDGGCIKPNHAKLIKDAYANQIVEAKEIIAWECDQIKEGYSFMTPKMRKEYLTWFEKIHTACDTIIETGKSQRKPRKKRVVSKEKMVAKLKFQVNESSLGIASIRPEEVAYANEVWVYNTKTRKVGVYHAKNKDPRGLSRPGTGLTIKGTTIKDYDTEQSFQKTLRKPAEQIKNWTGNAKTRFAKAFEEVKAVETKLNGRLNDTTIILKAF
jgi:hypothetical protein